jgi:hypothetical protein
VSAASYKEELAAESGNVPKLSALRDQFAMAALAHVPLGANSEVAATLAYEYADAMLKARSKPPTP